MVTIRLNTWINAPVERCFRLASSVDFQTASTKAIKDAAPKGVVAGLLRQGETVIWDGPFLMKQTMRVEIYRPFSYFLEVMVSGGLSYYEHEHHFAVMDDGTRVRDEIRLAAPLWLLGKIAERMVLRRYATWVLKQRNAALKRVAESEEWRYYLNEPGSAEQLKGSFQGEISS